MLFDNLFADLFIKSAAFVIGITVVAQILGKIFIKNLPDEDFGDGK